MILYKKIQLEKASSSISICPSVKIISFKTLQSIKQ